MKPSALAQGLAGAVRHRRLPTFLGAVLLMTVLLTSGPNPAVGQAALDPTPAGAIPSPQINGHALLYGWGAATMPDGSVIIGDIWNRRVVRYGVNGNRLGVLFQLPPGQNPYGLAVNPSNGAIYVGRSACCTVQRWVKDPGTGVYSMTGSLVHAAFKYPSRMTVGDDGRVYVADMLVGSIFVFDSSGNFLFKFGTKGSGPGQLRQPRALAFDGSTPPRLYVADAFNHRVQVFSAGGNHLFSFGSLGTNPHQFQSNDLRGLSIDRDRGWVYVVDNGPNLVKKFDLAGNWLLNMGGTGGRSATTCCATPLGSFSDGGREATVDGNGNLWVGDMPNFRTQVFGPSGTALFAVPDPAQNPPPGGFNYPQGVAVDKNGNVIVSDTRNFRFQKFSPTGTFLWQKGLRGRFSGYALNYARGVNTDPRDASIVLADNFSSVIKKYDANGVFLWKAGGQGSGPGQLNHASQAAVGPDGTIYVADSWNKRVSVFNENGAFVRSFGSSAGFTMLDPRGITVDPANGHLWVADWAAKAVFHLRNDGSWVSTIGRNAGLGPTLSTPSQVAVDSTYAYVTDTNSNVVRIYNKATGAHAGSITGVRGPHGISISSVGILYVSELFSERISKWCVDGSCP